MTTDDALMTMTMTMTLDYTLIEITRQRHCDAVSSARHLSVLLLVLMMKKIKMMMIMMPCDVVG